MNFKNNTIAENRMDLGSQAPLEWPLAIYVEPSGYCNFKCKFCVNSTKELKKENMDFGLFKKFVDEIMDKRAVIPLMRFCGFGESVINQKFLDMLRYIDDCRNMKADNRGGEFQSRQLITNGSMLDETLAEELPKHLDSMIVSIEGLSSQEYEEITGAKMDFGQLVKQLEYLYQHKGDCTIYIKIHNNAIQNDAARAEKFFHIFTPISDHRWIENLSDMFPRFESDIIEKENGKFRWGMEDGRKPVEIVRHKVCPQVFKAVQIYANGDCVLCCFDWERKNCIGNLNESTLHELWHSDKADQIRERHLRFQKDQFEPCRSCSANDYNEIDNIDASAGKILERMQKKNTNQG